MPAAGTEYVRKTLVGFPRFPFLPYSTTIDCMRRGERCPSEDAASLAIPFLPGVGCPRRHRCRQMRLRSCWPPLFAVQPSWNAAASGVSPVGQCLRPWVCPPVPSGGTLCNQRYCRSLSGMDLRRPPLLHMSEFFCPTHILKVELNRRGSASTFQKLVRRPMFRL